MAATAPQNVLDIVYDSKPADWHQHKNGGGWVYKTAKVEESAYLHPTSIVSGEARVYGDARVSDDAWETTPPLLYGTKHPLSLCSLTQIAIGCHVHDFSYWLEHGPAIGRAEGYTTEQIAEYRRHFMCLKGIAKRLQAAQKKAEKAAKVKK